MFIPLHAVVAKQDLKQQVEALQRERDALQILLDTVAKQLEGEKELHKKIALSIPDRVRIAVSACDKGLQQTVVNLVEIFVGIEDSRNHIIERANDLQAALDAERERNAQLQALVRAYGQFGEILQREATYRHWEEKNGRYTLAKVLKWWREMREGNTNDSPDQVPAVQ